MKQIVILASGKGTNTAHLIAYFNNKPIARVKAILCNVPHAGVIQVASQAGIPVMLLEKNTFYNTSIYLDLVKKMKPDLIVLAGFLWKIPVSWIEAFPRRIINIHPALLPKFGGKGMYGNHVHEAVLQAGEAYSGITIHYVNEEYDAGDIIFQEKVKIEPTDTVETLAQKIHALEYQYYPQVIAGLLTQDLAVEKTS
ncbi:formyltetrahydrofolate-dependent phosphoribosylglycinamide formyltransferase [Thermoflavifilum aggregans]|uniref:Phosphoribosylglycinamide formyltransferase n=1 Tax=Thermoflavifilum aggregans TaxID=454188 RepID=A0A2M9CY62_9BACT|nr:phosphoribosylglycinamide formyltransferase [Thermoflavifilum aggregans]MBX6379186.1 phosphoribosylglycinamide formyltransferase [Thermoflavifilum aggregans]PJJ76783.1 formyltetrahydrofolate-dependent phosphoribosylglycinamide formyltransferase [Thermoflavifilum aggregans]